MSQEIKKSVFRVVIIYQNERRMLIIDPNDAQELTSLAKNVFQLTSQVKVFMKSLNAEVFSTQEVFEGDELEIISVENQEDSLKAEEEDSKAKNVISNKIGLTSIKSKEFKGKDLFDELKAWALPLKFTIAFPNGASKQKNKIRRTVRCSVKDCGFKLFFGAALLEGKDYDELMFTLENSKDDHNHHLDFKAEEILDTDVINEINHLKGKMKTNTELQNHLNIKFNKNLTYSQVSHAVTKTINENFGKPDEDAYRLLEEIEKDIKLNGGDFRFDVDKSTNGLKRILYVSQTMFNYSKYFLDMVIVDATYKRNRFNMPLINVVGVNNYGRTILLAFGLMDDEKADSYLWFFSKLKEIWNSEPVFFISDEYAEIINGKICFILGDL